MKSLSNTSLPFFFIAMLIALISCNGNPSAPSKQLVDQINLKRGAIISCGAADKQFGSVDFSISGNEKTKKDFNLAIELLHSFEYDESEKVFAKIIDETPGCAMAFWGVAMSNLHPLWTPPTEAELKKGNKAIEVAKTITKTTTRESAYINAMGLYYTDSDKTDHHSRCVRYEKAMEKIHKDYPADKEAAIFYALALDASARATDKTYANQKKAAAILNALYPAEPNHPGIIHYIIHTYDYPSLAELALPAARKYASVAPSSAHALHMPSHIFTRLGLWDECIQSNIASVHAAQCYAEQAGITGHWDEELHGMDYLAYAYLQKGDNKLAREQLEKAENIKDVSPVNFKVAYAFAAIPARFVLENQNWTEAAKLPLHAGNFPWQKFPWQEAINHFARLLGAAHTGKIADAKTELARLQQLRDTLDQQKDSYKSKQLAIQIKTGEAWMQLAGGRTNDALAKMKMAAAMEDSTEKHPVTPGEVLPARELLGDMLLQQRQYQNALLAYEAVLEKSPNRFNSVYGAAIAADKAGQKQKAVDYFKKLLSVSGNVQSDRPEISTARKYLML